MRYVYQAAYKALGISHPKGSEDVVLWQTASPNRRLMLTNKIDDHFAILDRHAALTWMMLEGLVGKHESEDFNSALEERIAKVRAKREPNGSPVLLFEAIGEIDADLNGPGREFDDFELRWDVFDKDHVRDLHAIEVSAGLAGIRLSAPDSCKFERLADGSYLKKEDNHIIHSVSAKFGAAEVYVSKPFGKDAAEKSQQVISSIVNNDGLGRVAELFAMSLERKRDKFQSYVNAWAALEILVGKIFRQYEKALIERFSDVSSAPGLQGYLSRVTDVMNGRYTLVDRFSVISIFLGGENSENDLSTFKKCKEVRDNIFHGKLVKDEDLPLEDVFSLLDGYLGAFLQRDT